MAEHSLFFRTIKAQKPYQVFCEHCGLYIRLGLTTLFTLQNKITPYFEALAGDDCALLLADSANTAEASHG